MSTEPRLVMAGCNQGALLGRAAEAAMICSNSDWPPCRSSEAAPDWLGTHSPSESGATGPSLTPLSGAACVCSAKVGAWLGQSVGRTRQMGGVWRHRFGERLGHRNGVFSECQCANDDAAQHRAASRASPPRRASAPSS